MSEGVRCKILSSSNESMMDRQDLNDLNALDNEST